MLRLHLRRQVSGRDMSPSLSPVEIWLILDYCDRRNDEGHRHYWMPKVPCGTGLIQGGQGHGQFQTTRPIYKNTQVQRTKMSRQEIESS
ncbi:hypothetical protein N7509_010222 [Penicillium cosmopolitanum]|uniref:Uncharacterized protein n=1 Tax=Penicillium cosmopolitanum TaxID=1131564 RepID=A0A9X0B4F7_9EURO|nr:uncharacterized protein N7509_010222 [Penicillium cosmopolitanum]KAJ5387681.1 hypothetical protein N7509_010222 [Penicillium cosmopolitanum]